MRLIDADAIKLPKGFFEKVDNVPKFYDWLNSQPTINPVKYGKWINKNGAVATCSACGSRWGVWSMMNFCPFCGAEMEIEDGFDI